MNRKVLAVVALAALAVSGGCLSFFSSNEVSSERLDESPAGEYAWDESVDAHITVTADARFRAVYQLNGTEIEIFRRDGFGSKTAIPISAFRYRYPNGTVINGSAFKARGGTIRQTRDATTVTLPSDAGGAGEVAFTAGATPKRFAIPTFVEGSYEVVLPPGRRVGVYPFGNVIPGGYETRVDASDRTHVVWEEVTTNSILVQFYLERDLYIFAAIALSLIGVGVVGFFYYRRKITALREERQELGLGVDVDDDRRRPPPGMK